MTTFQLTMLGLFLASLAVNYGTQLKKLLPKSAPAQAPTPPTKPTTAYTVQDLTMVSELRDRLAALGCNEGVEACKMLLRVMIEFKLP